MAVIRELNLLGQMRWDAPQIRSIESAVRGDFDLLTGTILTGQQPIIVNGFALTNTNVDSPASSIQVVVANSVTANYNATESGSMFVVPGDRANETLSSLNAKVLGSFTANATNYVGVDIRRLADASTSDILQFLNATTLLETARTVPLARTLDYRFVISTTDFSTQAHLCPIAIVVTDSSNNISSVTDARQLMFRLAPGGSFASTAGSYGWPGGRNESTTLLDMSSGDKSITSLVDWMKASMTRTHEIGGGEFWYSATADRNVTMIWQGETFDNGENFEWDGADLHWQGVRFLFDNSTGNYNIVSDQLTDLAGLTDLADGECLYVDLDRTQNATLDPVKAVMSTLGPGSVPGARNIIAWRSGTDSLTLYFTTLVGAFTVGQTVTGGTSGATGVLVSSYEPGIGLDGYLVLTGVVGIFIIGEQLTDPITGDATASITTTPIYTRNSRWPVGVTPFGVIPATTTASGIVRLNQTPGSPLTPYVVSIMANGRIEVTASGGNATAATFTGNGTGAAISATGGATGKAIVATAVGNIAGDFSATIVSAASGALRGIGGAGTHGVVGGGGTTGTGGVFLAGNTNAKGAIGTGSGTGTGITGVGGSTGIGVEGTGGATSGIGVKGTGTGGGKGGEFTGQGAGYGVTGNGGATGHGGVFLGGGTSGYGVIGNGNIDGIGGHFTGAGGGNAGVVGLSASSTGGVFTGGTNSAGIVSAGTGSGAGATIDGGVTGRGVTATGNGGEAGVFAIATDATGYGVYCINSAGGAPGGGSALNVSSGHARFTGTNPAISDEYANTLSPLNICKAWGSVPKDDLTKYDDGFNIYGAQPAYNTPDAASVTVTLGTAMDNAFFHVDIQVINEGNAIAQVVSKTAAGGAGGRATFTFKWIVVSTGAYDSASDNGYSFSFSVFGRQS